VKLEESIYLHAIALLVNLIKKEHVLLVAINVQPVLEKKTIVLPVKIKESMIQHVIVQLDIMK